MNKSLMEGNPQTERMEQLDMEDGVGSLTSNEIALETGTDILHKTVKMSKEPGNF